MPWDPTFDHPETLRQIINIYTVRNYGHQLEYEAKINDDVYDYEGIKNCLKQIKLCKNKIFRAEIELHARDSREMAFAMSALRPRLNPATILRTE